MNHVMLLGRMARDPEGRAMNNGEMTCSFAVAVERSYKDSSGKRPVDFIQVVAFRKTAELILQYFKKGNPIGIHGNIQVRSYQDREGNKRTVTEVQCVNVYFPPSKAGNGDSHDGGQFAPRQASPSYPDANTPEPSAGGQQTGFDDLPF